MTFNGRLNQSSCPVVPIPRSDKLRSLHQRFGKARLLEDVAALEYAISTGRGIVQLALGAEQMAHLERKWEVGGLLHSTTTFAGACARLRAWAGLKGHSGQ